MPVGNGCGAPSFKKRTLWHCTLTAAYRSADWAPLPPSRRHASEPPSLGLLPTATTAHMRVHGLGIERIELLDELGRPHAFETLWRSGPVVLGFVRHFGCIFCHQQVSHLKVLLPSLEDLGARLAVVGHGTPEQARFFMRRLGLREGVYTDPARLLYRGFEMRHGVSTSVGLNVLKRSYSAYRSGHRQRGIEGDPWQQGGTVVVGREGEIAYRFCAESAGEEAPSGEILEAVRRVTRLRTMD